MAQEIFIVDNSAQLIYEMREIFENEKEFRFKSIKTNLLNLALKNIPALFIIDEDNIENMDVVEICKMIRMDEDNSITPIIVASSIDERQHRLNVFKECVEYYIKKPVDREYIYYTIKNLVRLINTNRGISPLTGLPGNVQIHSELRKSLFKK